MKNQSSHCEIQYIMNKYYFTVQLLIHELFDFQLQLMNLKSNMKTCPIPSYPVPPHLHHI